MNEVRKTRLTLNSINSQSLTSARLLTPQYMADPPVSHVLSMEQNTIPSSKDKYVGFAKCVRLVLQQAVLDYLRPERNGDE